MPAIINENADHHYATLKLKRGASNEELHAAYRRLALMHHPDKNKGNEEYATAKFQEVQRAFEALKESEGQVTASTPSAAQYEPTPEPTPTHSTEYRQRETPSWFDTNWGPNFDNRGWNDDNDKDWFDERGWRSRGSAFASQHPVSQHPPFGVFGRFFTQLPPMAPLESRVERNRRSSNWRETRRTFRLFA
ncbi:DnaJ domain-containing protein [Astrocystis sublimbata]|nr:DnaJ domain-containing protein [Astrocystis sublimbata]